MILLTLNKNHWIWAKLQNDFGILNIIWTDFWYDCGILKLNLDGWEVVQKYSRVHRAKTEPDWMN